MHPRSGFTHNPNTNKAGILSQVNARRKAKGLPPLSWSELFGEEPITQEPPKPAAPSTPKQAALF